MPIEPDELELQRNYDRMTDRRLTIIETRFDTILPLLATKADLAEVRGELSASKAEIKADLAQTRTELKAEIRAESGRVAKWMATIAITMFIGFGGMFFTMLSLSRR
jgi:hypothetical protein